MDGVEELIKPPKTLLPRPEKAAAAPHSGSMQWKAVNQYPHRSVILGSGASRSRASSFFAFTMLFRIRVISCRV